MGQTEDDTEIAARIGEAIKSAREARGWSQALLSERLELGPKYVSLLESGLRMPSVGTLFHVSRVLDLSLDSIFREGGKATWASEASALAATIDPAFRKLAMDVLRVFARQTPPEPGSKTRTSSRRRSADRKA